MKSTFLFLSAIFWSLNIFAQDSLQKRGMGAQPTDITTLLKLEAVIPLAGIAGAIPPSFRMDGDCPPVSDQCYIGSCVSQAIAYGMCGVLAKRQKLSNLFSAMYVHYFIKIPNDPSPPYCVENDCRCMGSTLGLAGQYLTDLGVPALNSWQPDQCDTASCKYPPPSSLTTFKLKNIKMLFYYDQSYGQGYKRDIIRSYVARNHPVAIAMRLDESFSTGKAFSNSTDTWKNFDGPSIGGHAMLVVGYDNKRNAFLVMNSWGTISWNTKKNDPSNTAKPGYCWIDYELMDTYTYEALVGDQKQTSPSIPISELLRATSTVKSKEEVQIEKENNLDFFIENRYNQYNDIRLIPLNIDKENDLATIAIYQLKEGDPILYSVFNIKINGTNKFIINDKTYNFQALFIKPWRKFGRNALYYKISLN